MTQELEITNLLMDKQIYCAYIVGSHLYGTNTLNSDVDYVIITSDNYGKEVVRKTVNYFMKVAERDKELSKLLVDNPNAAAYIYCGAYDAYWGQTGGYTSKSNAGIYPIAKAVSLVMGGDLSRYERVEIIPIDEEKNKLKERIKELEKYG